MTGGTGRSAEVSTWRWGGVVTIEQHREDMTAVTRLTVIGAVAVEGARRTVAVFLLVLVFKVHIKRPVGKN